MEVKILKNINESNETYADKNREYFDKNGIFTINIMGSPGAGKTAFIEKTLQNNKDKLKYAVIEGDLSTTNDTERIARHNVPAIQINTLEATSVCHLHASMIHNCLQQEDFSKSDVLIIENVGNLVCPSYYTLGEDIRVVVLSVTEGEDKPIKYPKIFNVADVVIVNKVDLAPHLETNMEEIYKNIKQVSPEAKIIEFSNKNEDGVLEWYKYLNEKIDKDSKVNKKL
ncbi:MAG: hydrogenase nickel incorporation protein HypB [Spirochaetota bacterium]